MGKAPTEPRTVPPWPPKAVAALFLAIAAALPYLGALGGNPVWDDNRLVPNFGVNGAATAAQLFTEPFLDRYYRPLVSLSFYLEHRIWGINLPLAHATNIALHVLATFALAATMLIATGDRRIAGLAGLLFAVQPAQVAGVAWIGGRTDSLATLAVAGMCLFAFKSARASNDLGRAAWWIASLAAFAAAVFTKEQALPLVILIPAAYRMSGANWREAALRSLPFLIVAAVYVALWLKIAPPQVVEGEAGLQRIAIVGQTALYYATLLVVPTPGVLHTLTNESIAAAGWLTAILGLVLLGLSAAATVWLWKRSPASAWLMALAVIGIVPVLNLVASPSLRVAPYKVGPSGLAIAGLLAIGGIAAYDALTRPGKRALLATAVVAVAACAALTCITAADWTSETKTDTAFVRYDDRCLFARYNLGVVLANHGRVGEAAQQMEAILNQLLGGPEVWTNPGLAVSRLKADPTIALRVDANQGVRRPTGEWLARVCFKLAELKQSSGSSVEAQKLLETGRALSSISVLNPTP